MMRRKNVLAVLLAAALMATAVPGSVLAAQMSVPKTQTASQAKETEAKEEETESTEKITVTKLTAPEMEKTKYKKGTKKKDMDLPEKLTGRGYKTEDGDKKAEDIKIKGITWKTDYTEDSKAGKYTFTAQLPKRYELAKDVSLPKITIEITDGSEEPEAKTVPKETEAKEPEKKAEPKTAETKEPEKKVEPKAAEAKEPEKKAETKATEAKELEKKDETKATEVKKLEEKVETKATEVKEPEEKAETKITEAHETEKKPEPKVLEEKALETEKKAEIRTPEGKEEEEKKDVSVPESDLSELKITAFELKDAKITVDEEKQTITILMQKADADLKKLAPKVNVPEGVTVEPESEKEVDFSQSAETPVIYKLTKTADGSTREYKVTASICKHDWTPASCTTAAVCKLCQAEGEKALGHSFAEATCTAPKTCSRCHITEGSALGHDWTKATCAVKSTCTRCKLTQGELAKHSWSEWKVTTKATHEKKGKKERLCKVCGKEESKTLPKKNWIGEADKNKITGVDGTTSYATGANITFKAVGDRMDNKKPIEGDVRYKPVSWTCGTGKGDLSGDNSYSKTIQFTTAGDYTLRVTYERQAYKNGKWVKKGEEDVQSVTLKITGKTITTNSNTNVKTAAATGDNSPIRILAIVLLISLVLIIWMAVWNVRRKRNRK
ncbi:MAG: hypothetical protein ACI4CZ_05375 [Hominisplanchenecus sp.]